MSSQETKEFPQHDKFLSNLKVFIKNLAKSISNIKNPPITSNVVLSFIDEISKYEKGSSNEEIKTKKQALLDSFIFKGFSHWKKVYDRNIKDFKENWLIFFPEMPEIYKTLIKDSSSVIDILEEKGLMKDNWLNFDRIVKVSLMEVIKRKKMTLKGKSTTEEFKDIKDEDVVELAKLFKLENPAAKFE